MKEDIFEQVYYNNFSKVLNFSEAIKWCIAAEAWNYILHDCIINLSLFIFRLVLHCKLSNSISISL